MIWTLIAFGAAFLILRKFAFPRIDEALDKRRADAIAESIDAAERTKEEADQLLEEYRARLKEAREQADDIVARARKAADSHQEEAKVDGQGVPRGADGDARARTSRRRRGARSTRSARRSPT